MELVVKGATRDTGSPKGWGYARWHPIDNIALICWETGSLFWPPEPFFIA